MMFYIFQTFAERMFGPVAFLIPVFVAMSTFGGVNGILLTSSSLPPVAERQFVGFVLSSTEVINTLTQDKHENNHSHSSKQHSTNIRTEGKQ